jgi:hypothetical protein
MLLKLLFITYLVYALTLSVLAITPLHASSYQHHQTCKWPYSRLYVFTNPVQSECLELTHNGKVVTP